MATESANSAHLTRQIPVDRTESALRFDRSDALKHPLSPVSPNVGTARLLLCSLRISSESACSLASGINLRIFRDNCAHLPGRERSYCSTVASRSALPDVAPLLPQSDSKFRSPSRLLYPRDSPRLSCRPRNCTFNAASRRLRQREIQQRNKRAR